MICKNIMNKFLINKCNKSLYKLVINRFYAKSVRKEMRSAKIERNLNDVYFYINNIKIAKIVSNHLSTDLPNDKSFIFESSVGTALLTEHLLKSGAQLVRVFETNSEFLVELNVSEVLSISLLFV